MILLQLILAFLVDCLGLTQFSQSCDHWEHDLNGTKFRGPNQGAQLRLEDVRPVQADSNCPVAQERVHLFGQRQVVQRLVATNVQRPHDDRLALHAHDCFFVGFKLLVFGWQVIAAHVQEFRPKQADAISPLLEGISYVIGRADIGRNLKVLAVLGNRWRVHQFGPFSSLFFK